MRFSHFKKEMLTYKNENVYNLYIDINMFSFLRNILPKHCYRMNFAGILVWPIFIELLILSSMNLNSERIMSNSVRMVIIEVIPGNVVPINLCILYQSTNVGPTNFNPQ